MSAFFPLSSRPPVLVLRVKIKRVKKEEERKEEDKEEEEEEKGDWNDELTKKPR